MRKPVCNTDRATTYERVFAEQLKFRGDHITMEAALDDTQDAAFWVSRVGGRKLPKEPKLDFMAQGIRALDSHLFAAPFGREESRLAAGRAALVAEVIRQKHTSFDLHSALTAPIDNDYIAASQLAGAWSDLNTIKGTNTAAYALWEQAQQLGK